MYRNSVTNSCWLCLHNALFCITPDIDECAECHSAGCEQVCINTIGDFLCDCWVGYELTDDLYNCTGEGISGWYTPSLIVKLVHIDGHTDVN